MCGQKMVKGWLLAAIPHVPYLHCPYGAQIRAEGKGHQGRPLTTILPPFLKDLLGNLLLRVLGGKCVAKR